MTPEQRAEAQTIIAQTIVGDLNDDMTLGSLPMELAERILGRLEVTHQITERES